MIKCQTKILTELSERELRKKNIILFNVDDHNNKDEDSQLINKMIGYVDGTMHVIAHFRLGKFNPSKKRPIKVILHSVEQVVSIFKTLTKIKSDGLFSEVRFSNDYTNLQQQEYKKLIVELRSSQNENLTIKHVNGNPKIVKKSRN